MAKKRTFAVITIIGVLLGSFISLNWRLSSPNELLAYGTSLHEKIQVFQLILETIQRSYVEERSPDELLEDAIHGMLEHLDPHTAYLPPDNFQRWNRNFEGFTGIGIYFDIVNNYPMITGFVEGSPAENSILQPGDLITKINDISTRGLSPGKIAEQIWETAALDVQLTFFRRGVDEVRTVSIPRSHLTTPSVSASLMLQDSIGYIALDRFTGSTAREMDRAIGSLENQGMQALIIDMRDNGGGYLSAAVEVADRFLPRGRLIVYTRGRTESSYQEYRSSDYHTHADLPLVILINHGTASAAEIVAGALQDWDRALIVGTTSFGKGLVQSQFRFHDGSALLVTTSRYYTPLGRLIQRDYTNLSKDEYYRQAYVVPQERPSSQLASQRIFRTPLGRKVYGGGGIHPDIWSENNNATLDSTIRALYIAEEKFFCQFASKLLQDSPELRFKKTQYFENHRISSRELAKFEEFVADRIPEIPRRSLRKNRSAIEFLLRRELAYLVVGEEGRIRVNLEADSQLQQACRSITRARQLLHNRAIAEAYSGKPRFRE